MGDWKGENSRSRAERRGDEGNKKEIQKGEGRESVEVVFRLEAL